MINNSFQKAESLIFRHLRGFGMLLGLTYITVFFSSSAFLPHIHEGQILHDGDSCKKDECHISIYHPGAKGGCHHKSHLTSAEEECHWCSWTGSLPTHPPVILESENFLVEELDINLFVTRKSFFLPHFHFDRGPPPSTIV